MYETECVLDNEIHTILLDFEIQTHHLIPPRRLDIDLIDKKKETCHIVDFAVSASFKVKVKESEKLDKYWDLARELKNL